MMDFHVIVIFMKETVQNSVSFFKIFYPGIKVEITVFRKSVDSSGRTRVTLGPLGSNESSFLETS